MAKRSSCSDQFDINSKQIQNYLPHMSRRQYLQGQLLLVIYNNFITSSFMEKSHHYQQEYQFLNPKNNFYPLDRILNFHFSYTQSIISDSLQNHQEFFKNNKQLQEKIVQFLITIVEGVCSTAFNLMVNNICGDSQAKCYAAKNLLQNIKYLCYQISRLIKNCEDKIERKQMKDKLVRQIAQFICQQTKVKIEGILNKYPSTPMSGFSQKLTNIIKPIDVRQDFTYDFFHINKIKIGSANSRQQLISQIMIFLNRVKSIPYEKIQGILDQNGEQSTYEECFQKFNKNLIWIISQRDISEAMIKVSNLSQNDKYLFNFLVSPSQENLLKIMKQMKGYNKSQQDWQLIQKYQEELSKYQREHKFLASAKISKNTLEFQESQIKNSELKFKSSALLRVLVKWVEDLQQTLNQTKKYIKNNIYKFKVIDGEKDQIQYNQKLETLNQIKRGIIQQAIKKAKKLAQKSNPEGINTFLIDSILEQDFQIPHYNYQRSLKLSAQVNAYIGKETVQQLIKLISVFQNIPQHLDEKITQYIKQKRNSNSIGNLRNDMQKLKPVLLKQLKNVNLVTNRLGDLLRSKIFCTELQFIKLLTLLYQFDKYCFKQVSQNKKKRPFFKLIRIKDKLKDMTNNVLINYMFHDKLQCQLQICFVSHKDKTIQKTNVMSHFLYELTRGIYGVIPELANIVNQNDPICQRNQKSNLYFLKYSSKAVKYHQFQERVISKSQRLGNVWRCINKGCNEFSLQGNKKYLKKSLQQNKYQCLKCHVQKNKYQRNLSLPLSKEERHQYDLWFSLQKLQFSEQDIWLKQVIQKRKELQIKQIQLQEQDISGIYLVIYPTQKKVIVKLYLIFKHQKTGKLIIKSLQDKSQKASEFKLKQIYGEHKNIKRLYFQVNRYLLLKHLEKVKSQKKNSRNSLKQEKINKLLQYLTKIKIIAYKYQATIQFDAKLLLTKIQNKQQVIRISQTVQLIGQLEKIISKQKDLVFVQCIFAQSLSLENIFPLRIFSNLKELYLKYNCLGINLSIQDHPFLTKIDLESNQIINIYLKNLKFLKDVKLSNNFSLKNFQFTNLSNLQNLQMNYCRLNGVVNFQLPALKKLSIQANSINILNLNDCLHLQSLSCRESNNKPLELIVNQNVKLKQLIFHRINNFSLLKLDHLQTVELYSEQIFQEMRGSQRYLTNLKNIRIYLQKVRQKIQANFGIIQQQNKIGLMLSQILCNQPNLRQFHLYDYRSHGFIKYLDLAQIQHVIQDIQISSDILKSLKLNKIKRIYLQTSNLQNLLIKCPECLIQFEVKQTKIPLLIEEQFFKKCFFIQSIIISRNNLPEDYYFINNNFLREIYFEQSLIKSLVYKDNELELESNQTSKKIILNSCSCIKIDKLTVQINKLKEISIYFYQINNFNIKIPLKYIKTILISNVKINSCQIQYYDQTQKAELQYLEVDFYSLALLQTFNFFQRIEKVQHLKLNNGGKQQLRLSEIYSNIEQFTFELKFKKFQRIIIDIPIKVINIPHGTDTIIVFEFDIIASKNKKRQRLMITISKQCLLQSNFINNREQTINVLIKAKNFKSKQQFKEKNKDNGIIFTFINQVEEIDHEKININQINQQLQNLMRKLLEQSTSYDILLNEYQNEITKLFIREFIREQEIIQQFQQNVLVEKQIQQNSQLLKKFNKQIQQQQENTQKFLESYLLRLIKQKQFYKQLSERCYKYIQEDLIYQKQDYLKLKKVNYIINKTYEKRKVYLEKFRKQLLRKYKSKIKEDFLRIQELRKSSS